MIPKWKSTARLPKYMIDLQLATTSRTLTTFSPGKQKLSFLICYAPNINPTSFKSLESSTSIIFCFCQVKSHHPRSWSSICFASAKLCGIAWQLALWSLAEPFQRALAKHSHLKRVVMGEAIHFVATDCLLIGSL